MNITQGVSYISAYVILTAMGIHGVFAGLALGVESQFGKMIDMFIAMIIHKWSEALTVGVIFVNAKLPDKMAVSMIIFLAMFTPLGIFIGHLVSVNVLLCGIAKALSAGTFIYISTMEIIVEEFSFSNNKYLKYLMYCLGIGFVVFLNFLE